MKDTRRRRRTLLVIPDVSGLTAKKAAHEYLNAGFWPIPWKAVRFKGKWIKKPTYPKGWSYDKVPRETHASIDKWDDRCKVGLITSRRSGLIAADVDVPDEFAAWDVDIPATVSVDTGRDGGYHLLYDARQLADEDWPVQGNIPGGQVKSNGFIGAPPSRHPSGRDYLLADGDATLAPIGDFGKVLAEYKRSRNGDALDRPATDELWMAVLSAPDRSQRPAIFPWSQDAHDRGFTDDEILDRLEWARDTGQLKSYNGRDPWDRAGFRDAAIPDKGWDHEPNARLSELAGLEDGVVRRPGLLSGLRTGSWLSSQKFAPLAYAIPGLVPAGVSVMAGAPFSGKSILVLRFGLECARGGEVFGVRVPRRDTFYLALEDGDRRVQARCLELLGGERSIPNGFHYQTEVASGKLIATCGEWLIDHPDGLVLIDTLGKALERPQKGETTYDRDYRILGALKALCSSYPACTIIVNHHSRKARADDFVDLVSGTNAITGAADTVLLVDRRRGENGGVLRVVSRDMDDAAYAMVLERPLGWRLDGDDLEDASRRAETHRESSGLGERSAEIVEFVNENDGGVTRDDVVSEFRMAPSDAGVYLHRLYESGRIQRVRRGVYGPLFPYRVSEGENDGARRVP